MTAKPLAPELENFARLIACGVAPTEAYTKSGVGSVLACSVSQAERHPEIVSRVTWLKANMPAAGSKPRDLDDPLLEPKDVTREDVMGMLLRDRVKATATGQVNAAVKAAELIGKEIGMFVDRAVTVTANVDIPDIELAQRIAYLLMTGGDGTLQVLPASGDKVTTIEP